MAEKKKETEAEATAATAEAELTAKQKKRQQELAQSGYRVPASWYTQEKVRQEKDDAVAKNMTPTRPDAS